MRWMKRYVHWNVILCIQFRPHPLKHIRFVLCLFCACLLTYLLLRWRCSFTFNWIYISFIVLALYSNRSSFIHLCSQTPLLSQNSFYFRHFLRFFRFHSLCCMCSIYIFKCVNGVHLVHAVTRSLSISLFFLSFEHLTL